MNTSTHTRRLVLAALAAALLSGVAFAQDTPAVSERPGYGRALMTEQERSEHRERMRAATSQEERTQLRTERRQQMVERAAEHGITLPDNPRGRAMGPGRNKDCGDREGPKQGRYGRG